MTNVDVEVENIKDAVLLRNQLKVPNHMKLSLEVRQSFFNIISLSS